MQMNSLRQKTIGSLPKLVFVLFLLQPMMDVLSFWMDQWGMGNTLTLALRMAVLGATVLVGFCLTRNRRAGGIPQPVHRPEQLCPGGAAARDHHLPDHGDAGE